MQYLALIYGKPESDDEDIQVWFDYEVWLRKEGAGEFSGNALEPVTSATTLRKTASGVVPHDGPFAETKEVLGGYYLFECENLDRALHLASKCPIIEQGGSVEVRPIMNLPESA